MYLDTLAAAYAEVGDFPKAVRVQREAITHLREQDDKAVYESHLKAFESNSPCRE